MTYPAIAQIQTEEGLNHLVVIQYPQTYRKMELSDSLGWIKDKPGHIPKPDLALYMKQRTFLIAVRTEEGASIGTGFFINDKGLAITNWHVLPAGAEKYSTAYLYQIFLIQSSVDEHLDCFHVLAIVNSAAVNNGIHVSFQIMLFSEYMPRSVNYKPI